MIKSSLAHRNIPPHHPEATSADGAYRSDELVPLALRDALEVTKLFPAENNAEYREQLRSTGMVSGGVERHWHGECRECTEDEHGVRSWGVRRGDKAEYREQLRSSGMATSCADGEVCRAWGSFSPAGWSWLASGGREPTQAPTQAPTLMRA